MKTVVGFLLLTTLLFRLSSPAYGAEAISSAHFDSISVNLNLTASQRTMLPTVIQLENRKAVERKKVEDATNSFKGFGPGIGTGLSFFMGDNKPVRSAEVVGGKVRVTEETGVSASFMFETHLFFTPHGDKTWGYGPFVGVLSSTEDMIDAFSLGGMVGKRRSVSDAASLNVGLGVVINPKSQVLGDGIEANKPLPTGETEVRFKTKSVWGIQVMTTFQF